MSFMEPEIYRGGYWDVETTAGGAIIPDDVCGRAEIKDYVEGDVQNVRHRSGWLARLQAPGYMDATEWAAFPCRREALAYILEMYGTPDDGPREDWEQELESELKRLERAKRYREKRRASNGV
jgi:hypothetical protein